MRRLPHLLLALFLLVGLSACGDDGESGDGESFDPPETTESSMQPPAVVVVAAEIVSGAAATRPIGQ
jgi:hypothetical protein